MIVKIGSLDVEVEGVVVVAAPAGHARLGEGRRDRGRWCPVTTTPKKRDDDDMDVDEEGNEQEDAERAGGEPRLRGLPASTGTTSRPSSLAPGRTSASVT